MAGPTLQFMDTVFAGILSPNRRTARGEASHVSAGHLLEPSGRLLRMCNPGGNIFRNCHCAGAANEFPDDQIHRTCKANQFCSICHGAIHATPMQHPFPKGSIPLRHEMASQNVADFFFDGAAFICCKWGTNLLPKHCKWQAWCDMLCSLDASVPLPRNLLNCGQMHHGCGHWWNTSGGGPWWKKKRNGAWPPQMGMHGQGQGKRWLHQLSILRSFATK